jgi:uncharacterized protein
MSSKDRNYFILETVIFLIFLGLFTLIPLNQVLLQSLIIALFLVTVVLSRNGKYSLKELGLEMPTRRTLLGWIFCTLGLILAVIILKIIYPDGVFNGVSKNRSAFLYLIPFYVFVGSFLQEFIFRGYVFDRTKGLFSIGISILLNIFLFSMFHLPYLVQFHSNLLYLSMAAGVCWSIVYAKYPNLYLAWLSHAIVGSLNLVLLQKF